ncbi:MAG: hypothetical protein DI628_02285 [Blastochloris viridis]|uniref:Uncharacterized protein n=1 Tax=Blastochloris viridis TaxID=1079 RepID=A0A6N4R465_BLAVI|nr:MAG: hypothetical protein DI628_02285 [Blastochloris viridis]
MTALHSLADNDSTSELLRDFPFDLVTPRVQNEAHAIMQRIQQARKIGRRRADILRMNECYFESRNDISSITLLLFEKFGIFICERSLPGHQGTMGYQTPAITMLHVEWNRD